MERREANCLKLRAADEKGDLLRWCGRTKSDLPGPLPGRGSIVTSPSHWGRLTGVTVGKMPVRAEPYLNAGGSDISGGRRSGLNDILNDA